MSFSKRIIFFLGWVLSPFTPWNDSFINIPIAYLLANIFAKDFVHAPFVLLMLVFYWLSNAAGLFLMYVSGKGMIKKGRGMGREIITLLATICVYSAILYILDRYGILKPIPLYLRTGIWQ